MAEGYQENSYFHFPSQKKSFDSKTDEWGKRNIESAIDASRYDFSRIRKSANDKQLNYDIANGKVDEADFERAFNPLGLNGLNFPAKIQDYPIEQQYLGKLQGEEIARNFNWRVRLLNPDAVSDREEELTDELNKVFIEHILKGADNIQEVKESLENFQKYENYDYQDYREKIADRVLQYGYYTQKMKSKFSSGFYDVLINAEEQYAVDEIMNEPEVEKINPANLTIIGQGDSPYSEDGDIFIIDYWKPIGKVIDAFWDDLKPSEIDELEKGMNEISRSDYVLHGGYTQEQANEFVKPSAIITPDTTEAMAYGGFADQYGNIRVTHVIWNSRRKVKELTYYDDDGEEVTEFVDEHYKPDESKGEKVETQWINEYWHGYKIGNSMYKRIEPLPRIGSQMNNPSICKPPVVGTIYTHNNQKPISLLDRAKPYKYLYDIYMRRAELASARDKGVLAELDLAKVPDDVSPETWMAYAEQNGWYLTDSFKQAKKGTHTGKLVGDVAQRGNETLNFNNSQSIQTNLEMAQYVKQDLSQILGITSERLGQIGNRETASGIQSSIENSTHITAEWFSVHDDTNLRVLELYLETAKHAWADYSEKNPKVLDFIDDSLARHVYKIDGSQFSMNDYGLYLDNSFDTDKLLNRIEQYAHAALQNDQISLSAMIDIERDHDINSKINKLQRAEDIAQRRQERLAQIQNIPKQQENQLQSAELKMEDKHKQQGLKLEKYKTDLEFSKGQADMDKDGIRDSVELEREKIQQQFELEKQRLENEYKRYETNTETELEKQKLRQERQEKLWELKAKFGFEPEKENTDNEQ